MLNIPWLLWKWGLGKCIFVHFICIVALNDFNGFIFVNIYRLLLGLLCLCIDCFYYHFSFYLFHEVNLFVHSLHPKKENEFNDEPRWAEWPVAVKPFFQKSIVKLKCKRVFLNNSRLAINVETCTCPC